jgi:FkbM family methyltransferase
MKRTDRIKLNFTRSWRFPGKERLSSILKPSDQLKASLTKGITWLTEEDIAIYTSADNFIELTILGTGTYEEEINKLMRISLKNGGNALDIGANFGLQSIRMSQCAGSTGKVLAFEPLAHLQDKFRKNMQLNRVDNVVLLPYALSNEESETEFAINKTAWNQGTFSLGNKNDGDEKQLVTIKIGDNLPEVQQLESLQLIKIDVEGFEYPALQGLQQTIQKHKPRIIFEYDAPGWQHAGQDISACYQFLQAMDYTLYQISYVGCELLEDAGKIQSGYIFCIPNA